MIRRVCRKKGHRWYSRITRRSASQILGSPWDFCYRLGCKGSRVNPRLEAELKETNPNLLGILRNV